VTTGRQVLVDVLRSEGVVHVFGNPGTTELPLIDALAEDGSPAGEARRRGGQPIHYVLALQEATAVAMADGYAHVTGRPAFLNLHTSAGLGNAIGNLTNAQANRSPLVVTAGQQDYRHIATDPLLAGDLVGLARAVSKWSHEVRTLGELGTILRRAFHDAAAPPAGPVFVSLPMDLVDGDGPDADIAPPAPSTLDGRVLPSADRVRELAELLADAAPGGLAVVAGDEVGASGAIDSMVAVAEALGAPVYGPPLASAVSFPTGHPLWQGNLPAAAAGTRAALDGFRRVFAIGGSPFLVYPYTPGPAVPPHVELVHLSAAASDVGRAHPVRLGLVGDPRATLDALLPVVRDMADGAAAADALDEARRASTERRARYEQAARDRYDAEPTQPIAAAHALLTNLPPGTSVVDESITMTGHVRGFVDASRHGEYLFCKGGGLGWGMPASLGVSLGRGREPVLCIVGDGSAMYSPQALWTAAHEGLPVVFAVVNNRQYLILKNALRQREGAAAANDRFIGMDVVDPAIDYVALARSMGVDAQVVTRASDIGDAVKAAMSTGRPSLIEIPVAAR
jgi:benzoylformate decarboxylase